MIGTKICYYTEQVKVQPSFKINYNRN